MEELDHILESRHVVFEDDEDILTVPTFLNIHSDTANQSIREAALQRESRMETFLRQDVMAPNIVQFSKTSMASRKSRRILAVAIALTLSASGIYHFSRILSKLAFSNTLDIERKAVPVTNSDGESNGDGQESRQVLSRPAHYF